MIDIELIKTSYAKMPDEQLIFLLKNEGSKISHEAFIILKKEFRKRNLPEEIIIEAENIRNENTRNKIIATLEEESVRVNHKLWEEIFKLKSEGEPDSEIRNFLLNEGLRYEQAEFYISQMGTVAEETLKKTKRYILRAILSLLLGSMLLIWNYFSFISVMTIVVGVMIFLSAAGAWAKLDAFQSRLKKALNKIQASKSIVKT